MSEPISDHLRGPIGQASDEAAYWQRVMSHWPVWMRSAAQKYMMNAITEGQE